MEQIQQIKDFGISWNREQRNNLKRTLENTEYQKALSSIGIEILNKSLFTHKVNTRIMNINSYYNYAITERRFN